MNPEQFEFYDEGADSLTGAQADGSGGFPTSAKIDKVIETLGTKEVKYENRELIPKGKKKLMLYLGDKNFENDFKDMRDLIVGKKKYERSL